MFHKSKWNAKGGVITDKFGALIGVESSRARAEIPEPGTTSAMIGRIEMDQFLRSQLILTSSIA